MDFQIDYYEASDAQNKEMNPNNALKKSKIRPFGKWHEFVFTDNEKNLCFAWNSILSVSRSNILQKPKKYYQKLIDECNSDPNEETVHYIERSWYSIFYPYPDGVYMVDESHQ